MRRIFLTLVLATSLAGCTGIYETKADSLRQEAELARQLGDEEEAARLEREAAEAQTKADSARVQEDAILNSVNAAAPLIPFPFNLILPGIAGAAILSTRRAPRDQ